MAYLPPLKTRMSQTHINDLYNLLHLLDKVFQRTNLNYWMAAGTALGAVRHGGLIPWDDDGDVYVLEHEFNRSALLFHQVANTFNIHIAPHFINGTYSTCWYKAYLGNQVFPNVDIFCMSWDNIEHCWKLSDPTAYSYWPKELITNDEIAATKRVPFGSLKLPLFGYPERYMERTYGNDWNKVVWEGWDHQNEKAIEKQERPFNDHRPALPTIAFDT